MLNNNIKIFVYFSTCVQGSVFVIVCELFRSKNQNCNRAYTITCNTLYCTIKCNIANLCETIARSNPITKVIVFNKVDTNFYSGLCSKVM